LLSEEAIVLGDVCVRVRARVSSRSQTERKLP